MGQSDSRRFGRKHNHSICIAFSNFLKFKFINLVNILSNTIFFSSSVGQNLCKIEGKNITKRESERNKTYISRAKKKMYTHKKFQYFRFDVFIIIIYVDNGFRCYCLCLVFLSIYSTF